MGLKEGSLQSLIGSGCATPINDLGNSVFHHMLQALDFLARKGIIHRDVKPENILYVSREESQYVFQLGDFGLCNHALIAATFAGSPLYMAPEMFQKGEQTHKVDVWSLYVTMLWTLDVGGFRKASNGFKSIADAQGAVLFAASAVNHVSRIGEMAMVDPEERASAAQMLIKCYNGEGLATPRNQVPPLVSPAKAHTKAPASAGPASTCPASKPRGFQRKPNPAPAEGQFRVEKARFPRQAQPRQLIRPNERQALGPRTSDRRIPGRFPDDTIDT
jgi:serine/threonine protein kinase